MASVERLNSVETIKKIKTNGKTFSIYLDLTCFKWSTTKRKTELMLRQERPLKRAPW